MSLRFKESLSWRAGKPIPVGELLRRLKELANELASIEQEDADRESLLPVAKELASPNLLSHKDRGVRAYTACCAVEMFKLCAPNAPYTASQLKDIFTLIVQTVVPALADPSNPYNQQHLHVLKSLAEFKSIVLLVDIPASSNLVLHLFTVCFDVLSGPSKADSGEELSKNVEHHMTSVLVTIVEEAEGLTSEAVDVILAQFLRADPSALTSRTSKINKTGQIDSRQSTLLLKEAPPAYNMAMNICNACPDKMARYIKQYFSSVLVDAAAVNMPSSKHRSHKRTSSELDDSDDEAIRGRSDEDLHEMKKAHQLLRELWRSCPSVLQDLIPQIDAELSAEDVQMRLLGTETFGDMIAGIGAAGPPRNVPLDPSAYPSQSLSIESEKPLTYNFLTSPKSPHSFPSRYPDAYHGFIARRNDKSAVVRAAWALGVGRILMTAAGGVGLDSDEEQRLLKFFSVMLVDSDERVRLSAVKAIEGFAFIDVVQKLGNQGGIADADSTLRNLADRVKDRKPHVRTEATKLLGRLWGVAAGAIADGDERISRLLGLIPSRILEAYYVNDLEINVLVDRVLYESLLPLDYPPVKSKPKAVTNGGSQKQPSNSQPDGHHDLAELNVEKIRVERQLLLIRDLESRAKKIMLARQRNQVSNAKFMEAFLARCEEYNGGVVEKGEKAIKQQLGKLIDFYTKALPEPARVSDDLWKFAKKHDRRAYQLIRFCMAPESDYRRIFKSIKELNKRVEEAFPSSSTVLETLTPLLYRVSNLVYNKSHVPAIMEYARTDEHGLGNTAHEILKEISTNVPMMFKAHVQELCQAIEHGAPSAKKPNPPGAFDDLKTCTGFAQKFSSELPKDRKFMQSLVNYALYGTPPKIAKYAVSVIMATSDKKEMYAKDLLRQSIKGFKYGSGHFLTSLAALSQLMLLAPKESDDEADSVLQIAIQDVLMKDREPQEKSDDPWTDEPDEDCSARLWALKVLVNRTCAKVDDENPTDVARKSFTFLTGIITDEGALSSKDKSPPATKARLRLTAATSLLNMCQSKLFDNLFHAKEFNQLALVAQDPVLQVRSGFVNKLMKYIGQEKLSSRFYTILFLLAFEPEHEIKNSVTTWLRARSNKLAMQKDTTMEALLARFLSLLAHHPDFDSDADSLKDFAQYIIFYLNCVATADNLSLIYHVAQRVKGVQDKLNGSKSENLYCLSDLSQAIIHRFQDAKGWSIQAWPGKLKMPSNLFAVLPNHEEAQKIANKQYIPEELGDDLDDIVKRSLKTKKRKSEGGQSSRKRAKIEGADSRSKPKSNATRKSGNLTKTPKRKKAREDDDDAASTSNAAPSSDRRRSGRQAQQKSYAEQSEDEDDAEMEAWDEAQDANGGADDSESAHDTPQEPKKKLAIHRKAKTNGVKKTGKVNGSKKQAVIISSDHSSDDDLSDPPEDD